uniref:O-methyltransferase C-terminal domain-containing protein n=1 Tax=Fagus sylvatica TaxID=28930 RepID=A0A2N9GED6_FAGSY
MSGFSQLSSKLVPAGEHGSELLLDAQAHIWNHIFNFINSMSLKCAIELGENIEQEDLEGYVLTDASRLLLKDNPLSGLESVVDVGGGTGNAAKAIANAFPK